MIDFDVDGRTLSEILALADDEAEQALFSYMARFEDAFMFSYARIGIICRDVEAYLLWEKRIDPETGQPCSSFSRWIHSCCPRSYATVYAAIRDVEAMKDVPDKHLAEIPQSNFSTVRQLSTAVRADPAVIEAAKTLDTEGLVEHVRQTHPDQHIEHSRLLRFKMEESAAERVEAALTMAESKGARNWPEALELICEEAMDVWRLEAEVEAITVDEP